MSAQRQRRIPAGARLVPVGQLAQRTHAMGQAPVTPQGFAPQIPTSPAPVRQDQINDLPPADRHVRVLDGYLYNEIPAFYTVTVILGGAEGDVAAGSIGLRPELFECRRITYANTNDMDPEFPVLMSSPQARAVEITWNDEFTRFFGSEPSLIANCFGDSNGFLDLVRPILFQGKQSLQVNLRRIVWPFISEGPGPDTRFDFQFQGIGLLPTGVQVSGSL